MPLKQLLQHLIEDVDSELVQVRQSGAGLPRESGVDEED